MGSRGAHSVGDVRTGSGRARLPAAEERKDGGAKAEADGSVDGARGRAREGAGSFAAFDRSRRRDDGPADRLGHRGGNGLVQSSRSRSGIVTVYLHDGLGRRTGAVDPRRDQPSEVGYNAAGQVTYREDEAG